MRSVSVAAWLLVLLVALQAASSEMALHILWDARVVEVECHPLLHEGHDYSIGGKATLFGRSGKTGEKRKLVVSIVVSRLQDTKEAEDDSQYLCHELRAMKESGKRADVLWSVVSSNLMRPLNAIRSITKLRGCDENDRTGDGD